jgi:uncharacterized membrane protein YuzA (DUF378 family)
MNGKGMHMAARILLVVGGVNWGLVGLGGFMGGNWNVVQMLLGAWPAVEWLVYVLVGASAVYEVVTHKKNYKACGSSGMGM